MKPHFLSALAFLLAIVSAAGHAQSVTNPETALFALPSELRASASLYVPDEDGSLREIRAGSGTLFCIADQPGDERFSVSCHPKSTYDFVERARTLYAMQDNESERETLERELRNGYYEYPRGTMSYYASGPIDAGRSEPATLRHWYEIAVPFATSEELGITTEDAGEKPWMMSVGSVNAHVMIDYRTITWEEFVGGDEASASNGR